MVFRSETIMPIRSYRDLIVWQEAMQLMAESYRLASRLPPFERFGLAAQIRRAAVSVPANIAEGHGRRGRAEYLHHLSIAAGSLRELQTHLEITSTVNLLTTDHLKHVVGLSQRVGFLLTRLQRRLETRRPPSGPSIPSTPTRKGRLPHSRSTPRL
jgi:four helix bundle protein